MIAEDVAHMNDYSNTNFNIFRTIHVKKYVSPLRVKQSLNVRKCATDSGSNGQMSCLIF